MKNLTAGHKAYLASEQTNEATCWLITRTDGVQKGFTDSDVELVIDGITYYPQTGFTPSAIRTAADLSVDNLEVVALLDSSEISEVDLIAGLYDYAEIRIFEVNRNDVTMINKWRRGFFGNINIRRGQFSVEMRGLMQHLQQVTGELYSVTCRADLGDTRCKVVLDPAAWEPNIAVTAGTVKKASTYDARRYVVTTAGTTGGSEPTFDTVIGNTTADNDVVWTCYDAYTKQGVVSSVTDNANFGDSSRYENAGIFDNGLLEWLTGNNAGYKMEVKASTLASPEMLIELFLSMPNAIQIGDTYKVSVGCNKTRDICKTFNPENGARGNIYNYRGEPDVPGIDEINRVGE